MRECQLCGAKSWQPLKELRWRSEGGIVNLPDGDGLRCDNCGAYADRVIIEKPQETEPAANFGPFGPGGLLAEALKLPAGPDPMTIAKEALESMRDRMPQPETRLERIVRAMIRQGRFCSVDGLPQNECVALVSYARAIEQEMDKVP